VLRAVDGREKAPTTPTPGGDHVELDAGFVQRRSTPADTPGGASPGQTSAVRRCGE
jgi:hypothetical protein